MILFLGDFFNIIKNFDSKIMMWVFFFAYIMGKELRIGIAILINCLQCYLLNLKLINLHIWSKFSIVKFDFWIEWKIISKINGPAKQWENWTMRNNCKIDGILEGGHTAWYKGFVG